MRKKLNKKTRLAINAIKAAMEGCKLTLLDMHTAINILVDIHVEKEILRMRADGKSIRFIARAIHMDDKRVSDIIIKANIPCKPLKLAKPTKPSCCSKCKK